MKPTHKLKRQYAYVWRSCHVSGCRAGFTLIELLSVLAIVAVLIAIIIPITGKVRSMSEMSQCASNMRQIGIALKLYMAENENRFPPNRHNLEYHSDDTPDGIWEQDALKEYMDGAVFERAGGGEDVTYREAGAFYCPSDENRRYRNAALSYGSNYYLGLGGEAGPTTQFGEVKNPSKTAYMIDMIRNTSSRTGTAYFRPNDFPFGSNSNSGSQWAVQFRHAGNANVLFVDGHVAAYSEEELSGENPNDL